MRPRHWEQLSAELGMQLAPGPGFTLAGAHQLGLMQHLEVLQRVADVAAKEYSIEQVSTRLHCQARCGAPQPAGTAVRPSAGGSGGRPAP